MKEDCYQYVRSYYNVPAYIGMRVIVKGRGQGTIVKANGSTQYVQIKLDGERNAFPYHPTDGITYLVEGQNEQTAGI